MTIAARSPIFATTMVAEPRDDLRLQCPQCGQGFEPRDGAPQARAHHLRCPGCLFVLPQEDGIWKALLPERKVYYDRFMKEYQSVRAAEGRGSETSEYYLALPYRDLSGRNGSQWAIRSRTFRYIEQQILPSIEAGHPSGLKILDLGAGNGWLSYRLAQRGHHPTAVDLLINDQDGLGAASHFAPALSALFPRFQAELDRLPFADGQFDLAIFNASFHYSEDYRRTMGEAIRCLRPGATVIIADTAWYRRNESGQAMLAERQRMFIARYGFASDAIRSMEYLTDERLVALEKRFGLRWKAHTPFYGVGWAMRPWLAKVRGRREPSQFRVYVTEVSK
jgi:SAM-dependent methyltransferase